MAVFDCCLFDLNFFRFDQVKSSQVKEIRTLGKVPLVRQNFKTTTFQLSVQFVLIAIFSTDALLIRISFFSDNFQLLAANTTSLANKTH